MTDIEKLAREAFAAIDVPPALNEKTLAAIEQQRAAHEVTEARPLTTPPAAPQRRKRPRFIAVAAAAAAACLAFALIGIGPLLTEEPDIPPSVVEPSVSEPPAPIKMTTAYVTIDVNPSIELALDATDVVIGASGLNDDGKRILAEVELADKSIDDALATLSANESFAACVGGNAYLALSVVCDDESQEARLLDAGSAYLASLPCEGSCRAASAEERAAAYEVGMGVQRYRVARELMELDPSLTWEDCADMTMRQLRDRISALQNA